MAKGAKETESGKNKKQGLVFNKVNVDLFNNYSISLSLSGRRREQLNQGLDRWVLGRQLQFYTPIRDQMGAL